MKHYLPLFSNKPPFTEQSTHNYKEKELNAQQYVDVNTASTRCFVSRVDQRQK